MKILLKMKTSSVVTLSFRQCFIISIKIFILISFLSAISAQQLSPSESKALLRLQRLLGYPPVLAGWSNSTAFCYLPSSPSLSVSCSSGRITGLTIVGGRPNATSYLPSTFSSKSLFTTLVQLSGLTTLSLVSLGLRGPIPGKVDRFNYLKILNLSSNYFSGELPPELSRMTGLQDLILRKNSFNGTVPYLKSFNQLRRLDLSSNSLTGRIPAATFSLPSIHYISLSDNKLTGELPAGVSCSSGLNYVDISNNLLVGKLPSCISSNSSNIVVVNSGNCLKSENKSFQHSGAYCQHPALAAILPPANKISGAKSHLVLILAIAGGVVAGGLLLGLLIFLALRRVTADNLEGKYLIQTPPSVSGSSFSVQTAPRTPGGTPADARHLYQAAKLGTYGMAPYRVLAMEELEEATNCFDKSNLIEDGPQGLFYKGRLDDGTMVAVKCLTLKQKVPPQILYQYLDSISKLRHRHLVSVLGHGLSDSQYGGNSSSTIFLVFEYIDNGTLRSHLTEWPQREMLRWPQRVAAVNGIARGIQFLHTVAVPSLVGNDLDMDSILMDKSLTAKISNYNLPLLPKSKKNKLSPEIPFIGTEEGDVGSMVQGQKEDIYQFGLILLEIITGKPTGSRDQLYSLKAKLQKSLLDESDINLKEMADSSIHGTFANQSLRTAVELSLNCVSEDPRERPSIDDVIWNLQYSAQVQNGWASSENLDLQLSS